MKGGPKYTMGLQNVRKPHGDDKIVWYTFLCILFLRAILLTSLVAVRFITETTFLFPVSVLSLVSVEFALSSFFIYWYARWEKHGHLVSLWEVLSSLIAFVLRRSLYAHPTYFAFIMLMLPLAFYLGMMTEFWGDSQARVPPFLPKKVDKSRPSYGWLGKQAARTCPTKASRTFVTVVLFASSLNKIIMISLFGSISVQDDMIAIGDNLGLLFKMTVGFAFLSLLPNIITDIASLPEFITDLKNMKGASKGYNTDLFEVAKIDDDELEEGELMQKVKGHKCCSITILIPCYMPNEEEILDEVLDYYKEQATKYPGVLKVLVVWNSPDEHPEMVEKLRQREKEWPAFSWERDLISTSKCDNLNKALDVLNTDVALLNDADTMVSIGSFIRASMLITGGTPEDRVDMAQCHSTHCRADRTGFPESGWFCFGPFITMADASKPKNMATQGIWKHAPFNGRGGFWRVSALKMVGFDHWSIGEDHDAMYRGMAYYGFKGILDPNLLCQEQEPPDCGSLTKQRIRWETAALEMRRTFPWILRSPHYSKLEAFVLIWSQLYANANLPMQFMPMQAFMAIPLGITKCFLHEHIFKQQDSSWMSICRDEKCLGVVEIGRENLVLTFTLLILLGIFAVYFGIWFFDCCLRVAVTRYRPRLFWCFNAIFITPFTLVPFLTYCQFFALRDYCFGGAKFIPTKRSPVGSQGSLAGSSNSLARVDSQDGVLNTSGLKKGGNLGGQGALKQPLLG